MSGIVWICVCAVWMWDFLWAAVSVPLALPIAVKHTMNYLEHDWEEKTATLFLTLADIFMVHLPSFYIQTASYKCEKLFHVVCMGNILNRAQNFKVVF